MKVKTIKESTKVKTPYENKTNFDDLIDDLVYGTMSLRVFESAYREYIRRRTDLHEGVRDILVPSEGQGLIRFASSIQSVCRGVELAFLRGREWKEKNNTK